ncbi:MAG: baseplate J/gp47 family protein [Candidatus Omnitrophica bacterium]|nr:baseplate J/gp47 family protein [Candidatus Omnitrophota bacterium]
MSKTYSEILADMKLNMADKRPDIETTEGAVISDEFEVIADEIENIYVDIEHIGVLGSFLYWDKMSNEELDDLAYNYGITRRTAVKSSGDVYFRTPKLFTVDIVIPLGTTVTTEPDERFQTVSFTTTEEITMYAVNAASYYNVVTGYYEVAVAVECQVEGVDGNVGVGSIKIIEGSIPNISNVYNYDAFTNGLDEEDNETLAGRCLIALRGASIGTEEAYLTKILTNVYAQDAVLVGPGNPLMTRDGGLGGKIDIYVKVNQDSTGVYTSKVDSFTYTAETSRVFVYQPVRNIVSIVGSVSGPLISGVHYQLTKTTSTYKNSIMSIDQVDFLVALVAGETITMTYNYFIICQTLTTLIESVRPITADVLIKLADEIEIDITATVVADATITDKVALAATIKTAVESFLTTNTLGGNIEQADIIQLIHNIEGVDNIIIPIGKLARAGLIGVADITLNENEYSAFGTITINVS